jgi:hypothetical protein
MQYWQGFQLNRLPIDKCHRIGKKIEVCSQRCWYRATALERFFCGTFNTGDKKIFKNGVEMLILKLSNPMPGNGF